MSEASQLAQDHYKTLLADQTVLTNLGFTLIQKQLDCRELPQQAE